MAASITVPRLGWSMEEGTFVDWLKHDGDRIEPGDALFVLENDKSAEEIEALDAGVLRITSESPKAGDTVKVGQVIAYLVAEGEELAPAVFPVATGSLPVAEEPTGKLPVATSRRPAISPRARRLARESGVDWSNLQGSGRTGRIRERDIRAAAKAQNPSPQPPPRSGEGEEDLFLPLSASGRGLGGGVGAGGRGSSSALQEGKLIPHTPIRRTIAARMVAGVTQAAPVTLTAKLDATNLVNLREQFRTVSLDDAPSYADLITKLTAAALRQHPLLQAQWRDDALFVPDRIDIALAVDTPDGVLAPVIRGADGLTLRELAAESRHLIGRAREGRLTAEQMRDATFTITNLGMFGVDGFTPIINLPQCAVLGVGRIVREPAVHEGAVVVRDRITLSLTFDHRVVDGAPAARFLDTLGRCLEQPVPWLMP